MLTPAIMAKLTAGAISAQPFKSVLVIDGIRHEGTRGTASSARQYRPEGFGPNYRQTWIGPASGFDLAKLPKIGKTVTVDSQPLEISGIPEVSACGTLLRIDLRTPGATG